MQASDVNYLIVWTVGKAAGIEVLELLKILQKANTEGSEIRKALELATQWAYDLRSLGQIQTKPPAISRSSPLYDLFYLRKSRGLRKFSK